jgi:ATP-dependent helicase/nuclease subunit B
MSAPPPVNAWPVQPALVDALESAILRCREANSILPVHVLVPNHVLGTLLGRALFAETGYLGIYLELPYEFAWRVAATACLREGLLPVPDEVDEAIISQASHAAVAEGATLDVLRQAVRMPGFASAAMRTLRDVGAAKILPDALHSFAETAAERDKIQLLSRIIEMHRQTHAASGLVDRETIYARAADLVITAEVAGVVMIGEAPPSEACTAFLKQIAATHPFAWLDWPQRAEVAPRRAGARARFLEESGLDIGSLPGQRESRTSLERLQSRLFGGSTSGTPEPLDDSVRLLSAPGESFEAVEIARQILAEAARGVRFQEMAVLLREPSAYSAHLASAFDRAGVPGLFLDGVPRIDPAARALGLLLNLLGANLDRAQVVEFLTTARIPYRAFLGPDAEVSPTRWDRISAHVGIVNGLEHWRLGLARARARAEEQGFDDQVALIVSLGLVVEKLSQDLAAFPAEGSWGEFLSATLRLLDIWIDRGALTRERFERVLSPMDRFAPNPTREQFLARVRDLIATQVYREGSLADGRIFVGSTSVARGLQFRVVFVPGLVERRFPAMARPDPLLLDEERRGLSASLRITEDAQEQERVAFVEACAAARERLVLSYPRVDAQSGRERIPSSFLLRAARAALGGRVSAPDLARLASAGETSLGRPFPHQADAAFDVVERDLALVASAVTGAARHLLTDVPSLARAFAAERASWYPALTPWDGLVDVDACADAIAKLRLVGREVSASEIEGLAACPYRHFLSRGLGLKEWEEPEQTYAIDPRDRGTIMHRVLERLFSALQQDGQCPLTSTSVKSAQSRATTLLDEEIATHTAVGAIAHPALLAAVRDQMKADLDELLEREVTRDDGFLPDQFEWEFTQVPFEFAAGRSLTFKGKMDRLDVALSPPRVSVIDYKGGKYDWKDGEAFRGGRSVQLAIYVLAAEAAYPHHQVTESRYYYSTANGRFRAKAVEGTDATRETLKSVLTVLDDTVAQGAFAPVADDCGYCDFTAICGPHRQARAARKRSDAHLQTFWHMREIP